jgi:hypothetical protein
MRLRARPVVLILAGMLAASGAWAQTQSSGSAAQAPTAQPQAAAKHAPAQIDMGFGFYEGYTSATSGNGTLQTPENAPGGTFELRYIDRPLVGFEFAYGFNLANTKFAPKPGDCGYACSTAPLDLGAKASLASLDWVFSKRFGNVMPFAVTGMGFFITSTNRSTFEVNTVVRPAYIVGGGLDWGFTPRLGLRLQYRDAFYKAPDLSSLYPSTGQFTYTGEPTGGFYYVF